MHTSSSIFLCLLSSLLLILAACTTAPGLPPETELLESSRSLSSTNDPQDNPGLSERSPFTPYINSTNRDAIHYVNLLSSGDDALLARLHLIRSAQHSIHIQTFIWESDETGRMLAYELIEAAKRGVRIRVLVDFYSIPVRPTMFAFLSTVNPNIEVKFYNPVVDNIENSNLIGIKNLLTNFSAINQRMHNKLFVVDEQVAITGGRNISNEYFDRGINRNFRDRDVLLIGPVVKDITQSFREYWSHPLVANANEMNDVRLIIESGEYPIYGTDKLIVILRQS